MHGKGFWGRTWLLSGQQGFCGQAQMVLLLGEAEGFVVRSRWFYCYAKQGFVARPRGVCSSVKQGFVVRPGWLSLSEVKGGQGGAAVFSVTLNPPAATRARAASIFRHHSLSPVPHLFGRPVV
eukprot:scaffold30177_cov84-Isochrysis_galbana.AAC.1